MGDRIPPTQTGYLPETSRSTPDRDPDGRISRRPAPPAKKKRKKKKKPDGEKEEKPRDDGHVDIRAFQIETPGGLEAAASSTRSRHAKAQDDLAMARPLLGPWCSRTGGDPWEATST